MPQTNSDEIVKRVFEELDTFCVAIYRGGSHVDPVIENAHDDDYILFCKPGDKFNLRGVSRSRGISRSHSAKVVRHTIKKPDWLSESYDFSQVRDGKKNVINWFSYLDVLMQLVVGEDVCPKTDIIYEHRKEFIDALFEKAAKLKEDRIKNKKRWYHILRGCYILKNNSYEVSDKQRREINTLHDLSEGWEEIAEKTWNIIKSMKEAQ